MDAIMQERLNKIKAHAKQQQEAETKQAEDSKKIYDEMSQQVEALKPRVANILKYANACVKNNIDIPDARKYGYKYSFNADQIYHTAGLYRHNSSPYFAVAVLAGGAFGHADLFVSKDAVYAYDHINELVIKPETWHLKAFLKTFPDFEKAFLNWIDSL